MRLRRPSSLMISKVSTFLLLRGSPRKDYSEHRRWHSLIDSAYSELRRRNTGVCNKTGKTFGELMGHFLLGGDETCLLASDGVATVIGDKRKKKHEKNTADSRTSITMYRLGTMAGDAGPTAFLMAGQRVESSAQESPEVVKPPLELFSEHLRTIQEFSIFVRIRPSSIWAFLGTGQNRLQPRLPRPKRGRGRLIDPHDEDGLYDGGGLDPDGPAAGQGHPHAALHRGQPPVVGARDRRRLRAAREQAPVSRKARGLFLTFWGRFRPHSMFPEGSSRHLWLAYFDREL
jgi:hypothetical protein